MEQTRTKTVENHVTDVPRDTSISNTKLGAATAQESAASTLPTSCPAKENANN